MLELYTELKGRKLQAKAGESDVVHRAQAQHSVVLRRALVRRCIELFPSTAHRRADSMSEFFGMSSHGLLKLSSSTWNLHEGCARQSCAVMRPPGRAPFVFLVSGCALDFVINQWPTSPLHGWTACNETLDLLGNHMLCRLN